MKPQNSQHTFSMYVPLLDHDDDMIILRDKAILHRLLHVLRCVVGDFFILFDKKHSLEVTIDAISKSAVVCKIIKKQVHVARSVSVTALLPLLKKEALEEAVYNLTEVGVSHIQLVITEKSRKKLSGNRDFERMQSMIIAAAEQSKNYLFPTLEEPIVLDEALKKIFSECSKILFEVDGVSGKEICQKQWKDVCCIVGPEGGLTENEIDLCKKQGFVTCSLTSTVLRARQAVTLGAALFLL